MAPVIRHTVNFPIMRVPHFGILLLALPCSAQLSPTITSWVLNPGGVTGYNGIESNVLEVAYSTNNVWVGCNGIPGYNIGPWPGNPNDAGNQDWEFKFTLFPVENTGTPVNTPLGHIGLWSNGVTIFNPRDAMSWNMQNIWRQNAYYFEGSGFDNCLGHPNMQMEYHTHVNPTCLYNDQDSIAHSPIIGYAFDGFPIYGAYAYANTDGTGPITRMRSSYQLRAITDRTTLPDGTVLGAGQYGPPINATYPLGAYIEDHEYLTGSGHVDEHNGRFCITPEYPAGTYAYFVSLNGDLDPAYPYVLGPAYYGTVQAGNTGPGSGHNDIDEPVEFYTGIVSVRNPVAWSVSVAPNPATESIMITGDDLADADAMIMDAIGRSIDLQFARAADQLMLDVRSLRQGPYVLQLTSASGTIGRASFVKVDR